MRDIESCFVYGGYLRRIVFHMMKVQDELLAPYGITSQQARAIGFIWHCRESGRAICQRDLETAFGLRSSSVSSLLLGLERRGFVRRVSGEADGRTKQLLLTHKGEELHDTFMGIFQATEQKILDTMTAQERETLLHMLKKIAEGLS